MTNEPDRIQDIAEKESGAEETREFRIFGPLLLLRNVLNAVCILK